MQKRIQENNMDFKDLLRKIEEADTPAAKTPQTYARAQEQMKRLEAAAQYSGTDEIVRSRYGLPPPLPAYEEWDGSMPQAGQGDWLTRNVIGRQASANVQSMNQTNQAQTASDTQVAAQAQQLSALIAQLQQLHSKVATPAASVPQSGTPAAAPAGTTAPAKPQPNPIAKKLQAMPSGVNAGQDESIDYGIANQLVESFGYTTESEASLAQQAALGTGVWGATKLAGKTLGKALPGVGLAFGAADAYRRATKGDYTGAALAGASGLASMVPGIGTAASLGLDAANAARDYKHGEFDSGTQAAAPAGTTAPTATTKGDPKVFGLQQKLIAKGAQIKADGIMGPRTQAAMQQYGMTAESLAETIVSLKDRMAMIEAEQQALEEGYGDYFKAGLAGAGKAWQGIKDVASAAGTGAKQFAQGAANPNAFRTAAGQSAIKAGTKGKTAYTAGQAVARNPGKAGLAATALGLGAGAALTPGAAPSTTANTTGGKTTGGKTTGGKTTGQNPSASPVNTTTEPAGPTAEEKALIDQINALVQGFGNPDELPDDIGQLVQSAHDVIASISTPAPTGSAALDPAKNPNPATNIPGGPETAVGNPATPPVNQSAGTPSNSNMAETLSESMSRWSNIIKG